MSDSRFAKTAFGRETCDSGDLARHRHDRGYMTVVLAGGYTEAGDAGRFHVRPGDVLIHRPFEAHRDLFAKCQPQVLNLPLSDTAPAAGMAHIEDPDAVARLAEKDLEAAAALVCATAVSGGSDQDWPDLLAAELRRPGAMRIQDWARLHGLAPATVSRGFAQIFGVTAVRYRAEARTRLAWQALGKTEEPLVHLALDLGFADQAHMTRSLTKLTGVPASRWRHLKRIQDSQASPPLA
jgi:AraC-like DNA-binding protein